MGSTQTKPDKTCDICYFDDGSLKCKKWYKDNKYHRDEDEPAVIDYHLFGKIKSQGWYRNGFKHRDGDKPAFIEYFISGSVKQEIWYKDGECHRIGGPAKITIFKDTKFEDGSKTGTYGYTYSLEEWYHRGYIWNSEGPFAIHYNDDIKVREVWHRGVYLSRLGQNKGSLSRAKLFANPELCNVEYVDYFPDGKPKREFLLLPEN